MSKVIEKLKARRLQRNKSQLDLSYAADQDMNYIARLETGRIKRPTFEAIVKVAKALDMDINELIE